MNARRDWFAILRESLRAEERPSPMSTNEVEALIADIVSGRHQETPKRRRGRRWLAGGTAVVVLAGGATAAALWPRSKPAHPEQGIACHATLEVVGNAQVIPPAADPLEACTELWFSGALPDLRQGGPATDIAPPLFACVGPGGGLEVFPNLSDPPASCSSLGLADANTDVISDPLVVLQDRLTTEINETCVTVDDARPLIEAALADVKLENWTITVRDDTHGCVFAGQDAEAKTVFLFTNPAQPPTT